MKKKATRNPTVEMNSTAVTYRVLDPANQQSPQESTEPAPASKEPAQEE